METRLEDYLEDMLDYSNEWNDPGKYVFQAPIRFTAWPVSTDDEEDR